LLLVLSSESAIVLIDTTRRIVFLADVNGLQWRAELNLLGCQWFVLLVDITDSVHTKKQTPFCGVYTLLSLTYSSVDLLKALINKECLFSTWWKRDKQFESLFYILILVSWLLPGREKGLLRTSLTVKLDSLSQNTLSWGRLEFSFIQCYFWRHTFLSGTCVCPIDICIFLPGNHEQGIFYPIYIAENGTLN